MVLQSLGWSINFKTPISFKPSNSSWEVSHLSLSSKFNTSWYELGASCNMLINILLILSPEDGSWQANCSLVGQREYCGLGGLDTAGTWPDLEGYAPVGIRGEAMGGFGWVCIWGFCTVCIDADRPGLGDLEGGWAGMTISSHKVSDSLSDVEIGRLLNGTRFNFVDFTSFAGNRVSSNFTSEEILKHWWAASKNWYPIPWIPVHKQQRSFLSSLAWVYVSSF